MKNKNKRAFTESAQAVETAHEKVTATRRDVERKRALFLSAEKANQKAEESFKKAKEAHDQQLTQKF